MQRKKVVPVHYSLLDPRLNWVDLVNRTYHRKDVIVIHTKDDEFGGLLNMSPGYPMWVNGARFRTVEALYQSCRFPTLPDVQREIEETASPYTMKHWIFQYRDNGGRKDWYQVKVLFMEWCLHVKLACNYETLGALLDRSGERLIVETSPDGNFWGGWPVDPKNKKTCDLNGANIFGQLLMRLRSEYRQKPKEQLLVVEPPKIPDALLFGETIRRVTADEHAQAEAQYQLAHPEEAQKRKKAKKTSQKSELISSLPSNSMPDSFQFIDDAEYQRAWNTAQPVARGVLVREQNRKFEGLSISAEDWLKNEQKLSEVDWARVFTRPILEVQTHEVIGQPVKLLARLQTLSEPHAARVGPERELRTILHISLADRDERTIDCFPILDDALRRMLLNQAQRRRFSVFHGTVYPKFVGDDSSRYIFSVRKVEERVTADDLIYVRADPEQRVLKLWKSIDRKPGDILRYIKQTLVATLGIKGLDKAHELDRCIDFMILQSLSDGRRGNFSMKLHSLVIGAPASGKKLLVEVAKALNPVFEHAGSVSGKLTPAALVGRTILSKEESKSSAGYLPKASGGTFAIEDFHTVKKDRDAVLAAFAEVMEDGTTKDSTSAKTEHEAVTSIHLDMNKLSQVDPTAKVSKAEDINIFTNVISRFDFVMDIPDDRSRQLNIAVEMLAGAKEFSSLTPEAVGAEQSLRDLKRMVAYLRTMHHTITISEEMAAYIQEQFQKIIDANRDYVQLTQFFTLQQNAARMAHSIQKISVASARARRDWAVKKEDVDRTFEFIADKLHFLQNYESLLSVPDFKARGVSDGKTIRREAIRKQFGGKTSQEKEIRAYLSENAKALGIRKVTRKTIYGDLEDLKAVSEKRGFWTIPAHRHAKKK